MFELTLRKRGFRLSELTVQLELASNEAIRTAVESGICATAGADKGIETASCPLAHASMLFPQLTLRDRFRSSHRPVAHEAARSADV
jgi:hypothetical protein